MIAAMKTVWANLILLASVSSGCCTIQNISVNHPNHVAYIVPAGTIGNQQIPPEATQSMGNDFEVNETIKITALGVFDSGGDGLSCTLHARIYDLDTQSSVADIEFTPEHPGELIGGSRY